MSLTALGAAGIALAKSGVVLAAEKDSVTIGWPSDVPSWDPNLRFTPDAQSLFKMVYDQPLDQAPDLKLVPHLITKWDLAPDALSLKISIRDDVTFHDGSKMTMDDVKFTFFERTKAPEKIDTKSVWGSMKEFEITSPTEAVMKFGKPMPTAPQWLSFLGSYVVSKAYFSKADAETIATKPMGTGPYKVVSYERDSRITLERNDAYWGEKPKLKTISVEIIKDASTRTAAVQSGTVDITVGVPVRETLRLKKEGTLNAALVPITRVVLLQIRDDLQFKDENVRIAAHHAIDKAALSKAFYGGEATPLSVVAVPGSPGYVDDYTFAYDPAKSKELLAKSGYSTDKPVKVTFATFNGQFPNDYDIARAIVQMWKKVGIDAELQTIEYSKYFELNRGAKLPDATLYSWDNATGDPEIYSGYLLNAKMPFSAWKSGPIPARVLELFSMANYDERIKAYKELNKQASDESVTMPLLQAVQTVVSNKNLQFTEYSNGWMLGQTMSWKS